MVDYSYRQPELGLLIRSECAAVDQAERPTVVSGLPLNEHPTRVGRPAQAHPSLLGPSVRRDRYAGDVGRGSSRLLRCKALLSACCIRHPYGVTPRGL